MFIIPEIDRNSIVSIAGAGGKTSLMFFLSRTLPFPCLTTTTTKVGFDQIAAADLCLTYSDFAAFPQRLTGKKVIWVSPELDPEKSKISGFSCASFSRFARLAASMDLPVVNEADGAHGRHIKSPAAHEPVIPAETTVLLHLTGLDVLGKPVSEEVVHRPGQFMKITGAGQNDLLTDDLVIRNILHPQSGFTGVPPGCRKIAVLTQADTAEREAHGRNIAERLLSSGMLDCVWITRLFPLRDRQIIVVRPENTQRFIF